MIETTKGSKSQMLMHRSDACAGLNSAIATRSAFVASSSDSKWHSVLQRGRTPATEVVCDDDQKTIRAPIGPQALVSERQRRDRLCDGVRLAGVVGCVVHLAVVACSVHAYPPKSRHGKHEQRAVPCLALPWSPLVDMSLGNGEGCSSERCENQASIQR